MMRKICLAGVCLVLGSLEPTTSVANHGHRGHGHGYRPGFSFGFYSAPPVYYAPPPPVVYAAPPVPVYAPPPPVYYYPQPYYQSIGVRTPGFSFFYGQ